MNVFVTGSTGFIGHAIATRFHEAEGFDVTGTLREDAELPWATVQHDWERPYHALGLQRADLFVHAAFDPALIHNEAMALHAAQAAVSLGARKVVLISSGSVYVEQDEAIGESTPLADPEQASPFSKVCRRVEEVFARELPGVPLVIVRLFYPYGPRELQERLIPRLANAIRGGREIPIPADGGAKVNPVWIEDAAEAVFKLAALEGLGSVTVNLGGPEVASSGEIARKIGSVLGAELRFARDPSAEGRDHFCDLSLLERLIGYRPGTFLDEGLQRMFRR